MPIQMFLFLYFYYYSFDSHNVIDWFNKNILIRLSIDLGCRDVWRAEKFDLANNYRSSKNYKEKYD